jgi:hypothetical protein
MKAGLVALGLLFALPAAAQDAAPADEPEYEEIVVSATVERVALLFDRDDEGRLQNCRPLISSGDAELDAMACEDLPDCMTDSEDREFCGGALASTAPAAPEREVAPMVFDAPLASPSMVIGAKPAPPATGPVERGTDEEDSNRLGKPPELPRDPTRSTTPVITISNGQGGDW